MLSFVDVQKDEGVAKPRGMKVVKAGYGDIDGGDKVGGKNTGNQRHMITGRRSFGNFNRALEVGYNNRIRVTWRSEAIRLSIGCTCPLIGAAD